MELLYDIFLDTALDCLKMLPFLFAAFLLIEMLEHHSTALINTLLTKINKTGPILGALLGCIPQCGFSVMTANLFSNNIVSLGTLLAVFLATSDEAILILLGHPNQAGVVLRLLAVKTIIAAATGYIVDLCIVKCPINKHSFDNSCTHYNRHGHHTVFKSALNHTLKLLCYLFLFSGILNFFIEAAGIDTISAFLLKGNILQPFLTALLGFIPNCAVSVVLIELYLNKAISFASMLSGLCTNSGLGLVILFRVNKNKKENFSIAGILYFVSIISGFLFHYIR